MILRFCSGSVTPASAPRNSSRGVDMDERDVVVVAEQVDDLLRLAFAQQAVVDEDAGELVADRLVDAAPRRRRNRRRPTGRRSRARRRPGRGSRAISRSRKAAMRPVAACSRRPRGRSWRAAPRPLRRVHHLGVELHAVEAPRLVGDGGEGRAGRDADRAEARRQRGRRGRRGSSTPAARAPRPDAVEQRAVRR